MCCCHIQASSWHDRCLKMHLECTLGKTPPNPPDTRPPPPRGHTNTKTNMTTSSAGSLTATILDDDFLQLRTLASLQLGEKLRVLAAQAPVATSSGGSRTAGTTATLMVDRPALLTAMRRSWTGDSREHTVAALGNLAVRIIALTYNDTEAGADMGASTSSGGVVSHPETWRDQCESAVVGLTKLAQTYGNAGDAATEQAIQYVATALRVARDRFAALCAPPRSGGSRDLHPVISPPSIVPAA